MQSVASRMSHSVAKLAVTLAKTQLVDPENTLQLLAQHAARMQKFLSSPRQIALFTAANASQRCVKSSNI